MNNIVPIGQARMPAAMRQRMQAGQSINKNFADGVVDLFPMLSIKGKVFHIRKDGVTRSLIDEQTRQAIPFLDVVLANASPLLAKAYYIKGYDEGDFNPPDCWSLDLIRPDPSVADKVNPTCPNCPMNQFGSAPSRDPAAGKRGGKACQDNRRIAVVMPGHLGTENPMVFLLKVPATSLKNLKAYSQLLERQGWDITGCVTRLAFDYSEAYPKLVFNFVDGLTDTEYEQVTDLAEDPSTAAMLNAPDFDAAVTVDTPTANARAEPRVRQQAPVMEDPGDVPPQRHAPVAEDLVPPRRSAAQQNAEPAQQKASPVQQKAAPVPAGAIQLATGEWFDPDTGEYVDAPVEEPQPAADPNVMKLPDGRYFNKQTREFVTDDSVGSAAALLDGVNTPKKAPPKRKAAPKQQAPVEAKTEVRQEEIPEQQDTAPARGAGGQVAPAPADLDAILKSVMPGQK